MAMLHRRMILGLDRLQVERLDKLPYEVAEKCYECLTGDDTSLRQLIHHKETDLITVYLDLEGHGNWLAFVTATGEELREFGRPEPAHHTMS